MKAISAIDIIIALLKNSTQTIEKTKLSKLAYLCKLYGLQLDFRYTLKPIGPYSEDFYLVLEDGVISGIFIEENGKYSINEEKCKEKIRKIEEDKELCDIITKVLIKFSNETTEYLRLICVTHFLYVQTLSLFGTINKSELFDKVYKQPMINENFKSDEVYEVCKKIIRKDFTYENNQKERLKNEDCLTSLKTMDDEIIDLAIVDPPYFRVLKQEDWDKFKNFEEYVTWSETYLTELVKKIRLSGTLLLYGCSVNMRAMCAINDILIKNGMYFVQEIIIDKGIKSMAGRISSKMKMLPPVSENIFVYRKDAKPFVKSLLKEKQKSFGLTSKEVKEKLGMPINGGANWTKYCGNTEFPLLPTEEHWIKICELFDINIPYSDIEETYNSIFGLSNVWNDIEFYTKERQHPSEKPLYLADRCVKIFSRENDLVYIPFAGGGNDIIACINNNRKWFASEINEEYIMDMIYPKFEKLEGKV